MCKLLISCQFLCAGFIYLAMLIMYLNQVFAYNGEAMTKWAFSLNKLIIIFQ